MLFRSGFEKGFSDSLKDLGVDFTYEKKIFEYIPKPKKYKPDFRHSHSFTRSRGPHQPYNKNEGRTYSG